MSNTVECTLFVRMEWIRNLTRISKTPIQQLVDITNITCIVSLI